MSDMLFFTARYIVKRIYDERVDFDYSYALSFSGYSTMLLYLLEFDWNVSELQWSFYTA